MNYLPLVGVMIMALITHGVRMSGNLDAAQVVGSNANRFGDKFVKILAEERSGNYISSPLSLDIVLAMAYFGAEGATKMELQQAMGLPSDETIVKNGYQTVIDSLNTAQGIQLALANKIFIASGISVKDEFKEITRTNFRSESENVDFLKSAKAAERINTWAKENTNNIVEGLFKPGDFSVNTKLVIANAVYFKGRWANAFDPNHTTSKSFNIDDATTKNVNMMYTVGKYNWGAIEKYDAQYLELPYENEKLSMFLIRPNKIDGFVNIEQNLNNIDLSRLENHKREVECSMPTFEVASTIDLESTLKKLNIKEMFENTANFGAINDNVQLKVSAIIQKSFIRVNEEGSEAAVVTGGTVIVPRPGIPPPTFELDRPFFFVIRMSEIGVNLFYGRITDPTISQ